MKSIKNQQFFLKILKISITGTVCCPEREFSLINLLLYEGVARISEQRVECARPVHLFLHINGNNIYHQIYFNVYVGSSRTSGSLEDSDQVDQGLAGAVLPSNTKCSHLNIISVALER